MLTHLRSLMLTDSNTGARLTWAPMQIRRAYWADGWHWHEADSLALGPADWLELADAADWLELADADSLALTPSADCPLTDAD